ncbi:PepSY domain-containing protein [Sinomicrobium kalidii]|uniref:PepSY-associated TM helix domain-containing protein n=1 Tax=Sinomicrobium kalidii TaxID=2900738 RepID=UPI001E3171FB|nr:PepSY-associated TM helix domain-containing protein [Sinomicrobium kalidii]UGU18080.1 PepSY domain-containing protein [Sinomicrobium kalidii]
MKVKKKIFFNIHSWIGIRLSILFFIVCFSGTLATLSHEMDWLFNPDARATPQQELASRNTIVANFRNSYPDASIGYWMRTDEPYLCDVIYKKEGGYTSYVFANPYTGEIQGEARLTFQRFFRDLHYFLFIPFQAGHFTVLIFAFLLLTSLITALVFYKKWWRKLFKLETGKGVLVFFRSLHRLAGLWSVPFTLLFSITGIWYFLERANVAGIGVEANPRPPKVKNVSEGISTLKEDPAFSLDYDKALSIAKKEIPQLKAGDLLPPQNPSAVLYLTGKSDVPLVRQRANRVYINPYTYEVVKTQKAREMGTVMWLNDIADPLHFGYWGGLVTKIIWFIAGLGISSLVLTGIWITLKRKAIKRKKNGQKVMGIWRYINWGICAVMLFFMYYFLTERYHISAQSMILISLGWAIFIALGYYIFVYRLNKAVQHLLI